MVGAHARGAIEGRLLGDHSSVESHKIHLARGRRANTGKEHLGREGVGGREGGGGRGEEGSVISVCLVYKVVDLSPIRGTSHFSEKSTGLCLHVS